VIFDVSGHNVVNLNRYIEFEFVNLNLISRVFTAVVRFEKNFSILGL